MGLSGNAFTGKKIVPVMHNPDISGETKGKIFLDHYTLVRWRSGHYGTFPEFFCDHNMLCFLKKRRVMRGIYFFSTIVQNSGPVFFH